MFLFTLIAAGAIAGLFFLTFLRGSSDQATGIFLLIYAAICYATAEGAVSKFRLYRYGIEEALAVCSVVFLCVGMLLALFSGRPYSPNADAVRFVVPAAGVVFSLWIWRRFGLWYAFPAAMIFALFVPDYWTSSRAAQHALLTLLYAIGLAFVIAVRSRRQVPYVEDDYSLAEAFLWLGIYLAINLQLTVSPFAPAG